MTTSKKIIFVCTGNVFRSMSAEKCLKHFLKINKIKNIEVDSAGIHPHHQEINKFTIERLKKYGIEFEHEYKKLTENLIQKNDLIIAMGENHQKFIFDKFNHKSILFNKLAYGKNKGILDIEEKYPYLKKLDLTAKLKKPEYKKQVNYVIDKIYSGIPTLTKKIISLS